MERGTVEPSPSERLATSCGAPSSTTTKSPLLSPETARPSLSNARMSKTGSDVSILLTAPDSGRSSSFLVSTAFCSFSSHFSRFRLEPNSSRFFFSCAPVDGLTKGETNAAYKIIIITQRIIVYRKTILPLSDGAASENQLNASSAHSSARENQAPLDRDERPCKC